MPSSMCIAPWLWHWAPRPRDDFETNESDGDATREQQQFLIVVQCAIYVGVLNVNSRFMTGPSVNVVLWISLMLL